MPTIRQKTKRTGTDARVPSLHAELRAMAYKRGPEAKLPTVRDLCKSLGTSWATLSDALDQLESQNVIYRKPGSGVYVSPKIHQKAVSLIFAPHYFRSAGHSPFWGLLLEKFNEEAWKRAVIDNETFCFHIAMPYEHTGDPLQEGLVRMIRAGHIDGILGIGLSDQAAEWIMQFDIPFVTFAIDTPWMVRVDEDEIVQAGVAALAARGCRVIGRWQAGNLANPADSLTLPPDPGLEVFRDAVQAANLEFHPVLLKGNPRLQYGEFGPMLGSRQEQGSQLVMEVFGDPGGIKPDGLVITDDMLTSGAMAAFQTLGIQVGTDVKIATHANIGSHTLDVFEKDLIMIALDAAEVAAEMFDMLTTLMNGETPVEHIKYVKPRILREREGA